LLLIAVIVALGVKMVGGLLTAALVAIPASVAKSWQEPASVRLRGDGGRIASSFLGIVLFKVTGYPAGPLIILVTL
jgi:ABC-type Mn2+/Zn2+ transport system permease subunit